MTCEHAISQYERTMSEELNPEEEKRVWKHLMGCQNCSKRLITGLQRVFDWLSGNTGEKVDLKQLLAEKTCHPRFRERRQRFRDWLDSDSKVNLKQVLLEGKE